MQLANFDSKKNEFNYEYDITKKIVSKILNKLNKEQGISSGTKDYNRSKIVKYFFEAELLFKYHDMNKSGELDIKLFPQMARQLKQIYDIRDIKKFEKEMQFKKINKMSLPMFLTLLKRRLFKTIDENETFQKYFHVLDMDKKNKIDVNKLKSFLSLIGDKVSAENFDFFFKYNITNNDKLKEEDIIMDDKNNPTEISADAYRDMLTYYKYL
ncbi:EF hand domain-containing protein [Plasmodium brasilianum]|uniref:EF-hand domain-containing protein n=2 Tax=Plasmodium (Plasmodium) TaxID=418103 RepID=A0A1D3JKU2_PLAMA|nr:conserved Plasmodium protein, unknown function [Plasmodium malariae]KAI4840932.1 EF hand domain-containing protein [Plasmodium brasilianum]SBT87130.1 conserved Plasmodium protein, unknown function [Plasmodium malariae]